MSNNIENQLYEENNNEKLSNKNNDIDFKYQQMLLKSITINKNLNDFYSCNQNNNNKNENNFGYDDFYKKNNLLEYLANRNKINNK